MPNVKSAIKNLRQSQKRRIQNLSVKSSTKTMIKKYLQLIEAGKIEEARDYLPVVQKQLDMAATKKVFHKNKSSRIKSRLGKKLFVPAEDGVSES
ncbi:30S ribosomal protein S20 [Atribacter laminatus]|jgi:small subunit ribosomal protein S20|uniref:Small ribosomal subunit protein bS20 n=1 Tax=Atribacter laminatus TaxID=2847778 RepID=A0A7T1ANK9_ATRLM|nr:30S ribosomal protein S20 [Atribacter laminatus]QPM69202.1 30S ribosomal protein S20 [Atribacter laminatus]